MSDKLVYILYIDRLYVFFALIFLLYKVSAPDKYHINDY